MDQDGNSCRRLRLQFADGSGDDNADTLVGAGDDPHDGQYTQRLHDRGHRASPARIHPCLAQGIRNPLLGHAAPRPPDGTAGGCSVGVAGVVAADVGVDMVVGVGVVLLGQRFAVGAHLIEIGASRPAPVRSPRTFCTHARIWR